eukprot:3221675-Lingulodinium_polyedra.AAC.1
MSTYTYISTAAGVPSTPRERARGLGRTCVEYGLGRRASELFNHSIDQSQESTQTKAKPTTPSQAKPYRTKANQ